ncbi:hypothetical protein XAC3218_910180 [Xanthomonas citri pv. citri]|uniref:Uncharacterized protein n=1 Tax=Xanthomonas citri pv. citri TaxID=611301 RepID=A0A0U5BXS7_XANCI|nr:hypothetical protein XAC908_1050067 [Xanthomonas citri pv. citri]CEE38323.1 hypothetical protein XAC3824_880228 [Xanthomonas citri pv. citri]CEE48600.1 hypothetical protein XAC2911_790232 [Xanthomonas citri pv. citri]CEE52776.1 hypothetical protein XACS584_1220072 [Xanthomonas citri pv. citri]CEE56228.1 hypothetical protein XAC3608_1360075 [Xanthomonas citri pv. citri]
MVDDATRTFPSDVTARQRVDVSHGLLRVRIAPQRGYAARAGRVAVARENQRHALASQAWPIEHGASHWAR